MSKKLICLACLVLVMSITGNASADLVAHWKFDETSGTTAADSSGNGLNGILGGDPQWVAGKLGGALEFDGDDYVDLGAPAVLDFGTEDFTITAWIKMTATTRGSIFAIGGDDGGGIRYTLAMGEGNDNKLTLTMDNDVSKNQSMGDTVINDGVWHHVVGMIKGDVSLVYVDGVEDGTIDLPDGYDLSGVLQHNAYIGAITSNASNTLHAEKFMIGLIDDVRIYDTALMEPEILAVMEGSGAGFPFAIGPVPADGSLNEDTWVNISWSPGDFAVSHDVYIGEDFDAVSEGAEGTFVGNQADTFIVVGFPGFPYPDGLVPGTTYYWRIDEVNDADPNSPWKGTVWSFGIPPKTAYFPEPADAGETVAVNAGLTWTPGFGAKLHTVYFGESFEEVDNAAGGLPQGTLTYDPGTLKMAKTYYWRVDEFDAIDTYKGDVWSFTTEGAVAALNPVNGAVDVTQTPTLTWAPGLGASHEIYFGADEASMELKGSGNLGSESYDPGQLEWDTTYYWRVDEANSANADSPWTGPLWSFTTANFLIIDDMEAYNDINEGEEGSNRIYLAWLDGYDNPAINGSVVGNANAPFAEQSIVHGGLQSMPMAYDNAVGKSEATLTLTSNKDWTVKGVNTLTIWFRGESANAAEQMYVALNGNARVDNDDPDAATLTGWTQWNIDLTRFADQGVNLANVNSITLGLSSVTGGTGKMYYDDIRLYAP